LDLKNSEEVSFTNHALDSTGTHHLKNLEPVEETRYKRLNSQKVAASHDVNHSKSYDSTGARIERNTSRVNEPVIESAEISKFSTHRR